MDKQLLRRIPKVDDLLRRPALEALAAEAPASAVTEAVRRTLDALRENILSGAVTELPCEEALCAEIAEACRSARLPSLRSFLYYTQEALAPVAERIADFARREGLEAHARSALIRTNQGGNPQ